MSAFFPDEPDSNEPWFAPYLDGGRPWLDGEHLPAKTGESWKYETRTNRGVVEIHDSEAGLEDALRGPDSVEWVGVPGLTHLVPRPLIHPPPDETTTARMRRRHLNSFQRNGLVLLAGITAFVFARMHRPEMAGLIVIGLFLLVLRPLMGALIGLQETRQGASAQERCQRHAEWILFLGWLQTRPARRLQGALVILGAVFALQIFTMGSPLLANLIRGIPSRSIDAAGLIPKVDGGEWWRLLTCGFLHGHLIHIWFNGTALYDLGRILVGILRPGVLAFVFLASLLGGSLASYHLLPSEGKSVGASGGILGVLGFLAVLTWKKSLRLPQPLRLRVGFSVGLIFFIGVIGSEFIDNAAHGGGFLVGVTLALILPRSARIWNADRSPWFLWLGLACTLVLLYGAGRAVYEILAATAG